MNILSNRKKFVESEFAPENTNVYWVEKTPDNKFVDIKEFINGSWKSALITSGGGGSTEIKSFEEGTTLITNTLAKLYEFTDVSIEEAGLKEEYACEGLIGVSKNNDGFGYPANGGENSRTEVYNNIVTYINENYPNKDAFIIANKTVENEIPPYIVLIGNSYAFNAQIQIKANNLISGKLDGSKNSPSYSGFYTDEELKFWFAVQDKIELDPEDPTKPIIANVQLIDIPAEYKQAIKDATPF